MGMQTSRLSLMVLTALVLTGGRAWAIEGILGQTKEQLKLKYDVTVVDHYTGRVTVVLTIADEGRIKPLDSVDLMIPMEKGQGSVDRTFSRNDTRGWSCPAKCAGKPTAQDHRAEAL